MTLTQSQSRRETELVRLTRQIAASPCAIELRFRQASLLADLGRIEESKAAYLDLLKRSPDHFGALTAFGRLLFSTGYRSAARTVYARAAATNPLDADAQVNLADTLLSLGEIEAAATQYEAALRLSPEHAQAHCGLADAIEELGDDARAEAHRALGYRNRPVLHLPYHGSAAAIRVLVLAPAGGSMVPIRHHLDSRIFQTSILFVDYFDDAPLPSEERSKSEEGLGMRADRLPPHDIVFNAIGNADRCGESLGAAERILSKTTAPVINPPGRIAPTGRVETAQRLSRIDGVRTARTALVPRAVLESADASCRLTGLGFDYPLLLRAPGFHTGRHFARVESESELASAIDMIPGSELLVIEYIDTRGFDGKIRKFRVMMIDGVLYPLHLAVSHDWKIHYFTAEMAENPEHRAEDAAFLTDMSGTLGPRAMRALEEIRDTLGLDYGGIDFSLDEAGNVVLFEANASMVVYAPEKDPRWDYRRPAVDRVLAAIRDLLTRRATKARD